MGYLFCIMPAAITRAALTEVIQRQAKLGRVEADAMVDAVFDNIIDALCYGEDVKISGFGTFDLRDKRQRLGRNPKKTSQEVMIPPHRAIVFRPSKILKARVSSGNRVPDACGIFTAEDAG